MKLQLSCYRGFHFRAEKEKITNESGANRYTKVVDAQNDPQPLSLATARVLAERYGVPPSIMPSVILSKTSASEAICAEWVTTITHFPFSCAMFFSSPTIIPLLWLSRFPVGSSANQLFANLRIGLEPGAHRTGC